MGTRSRNRSQARVEPGPPVEIPSGSWLTPEWVGWIAENLLTGTKPEGIVEGLVSRGVPGEVAAREVALVQSSPIFAVARDHAVRLRRVELVARLLRQLDRLEAVGPSEVERREKICGAEFYQSYYARNTPVVISGLMDEWPARRNWSPRYFRDRFGSLPVEVSVGRESDPFCDRNFAAHARRMTLAEYSDLVLAAEGKATNDFYLIANHRNLERGELAPIFDDVPMGSDLLDERQRQGFIALWYGPGGTLTPLHHDANNILFCQIYGRKTVKLISPLETALLDTLEGYYSSLDLERAIAEGARLLEGVRVRSVTLAPGEALFIPVGWWHHVRSHETSINLSFLNFHRENLFPWYAPGNL